MVIRREDNGSETILSVRAGGGTVVDLMGSDLVSLKGKWNQGKKGRQARAVLDWREASATGPTFHRSLNLS